MKSKYWAWFKKEFFDVIEEGKRWGKIGVIINLTWVISILVFVLILAIMFFHGTYLMNTNNELIFHFTECLVMGISFFTAIIFTIVNGFYREIIRFYRRRVS